MGLTVSKIIRSMTQNKRVNYADIAFDSAYAYGGESLTPANLNMSAIDQIIINSRGGYQFDYDYTNQKVKVYQPAPPIVFEEVVTVSGDVGTLKYPAAYIMYVGVADVGYKVIPGGLTPVTISVSVSEPVWGTRNTLTFKTSDTVTTCYVTYVTQAWKEVFDNYVLAKLTAGARVSGHASLVFTASTPDEIGLGEVACAIQSILWSDNGVLKPMRALYKAETAATLEATIDYVDGTETTLNVLQSDTLDATVDSVYIQYIRRPASGFLYDRFIEEDDLTPSSDVITVSSGMMSSNMLMFGACGDLAGPTTKFANIIRSGGSVGTTATLAQLTTFYNNANTLTVGSSHSDSDHFKLSYIAGQPWEIPGLVPLETPSGMDLSCLTGVKVQVIGR